MGMESGPGGTPGLEEGNHSGLNIIQSSDEHLFSRLNEIREAPFSPGMQGQSINPLRMEKRTSSPMECRLSFSMIRPRCASTV